VVLSGNTTLFSRDEDQVRFDDIVGTENHVERSENDLSLAGLAREIINEPVNLTQNPLVIPGWRRCHNELSPDDFVTLTVVRHLQEVIVGEGA
jgi:hypothetical protein